MWSPHHAPLSSSFPTTRRRLLLPPPTTFPCLSLSLICCNPEAVIMFVEYFSTASPPATAAATLNDLSLFVQRDVTYSCGSCGYLLNLSSCNRNTTNIGSKYSKDIRKGFISFFTIDESRFTQRDDLSYKPYFISKLSWGLFRRRTKLLCRKCGNHIGNAYDGTVSPGRSNDIDYISGNGAVYKTYSIKISAVQPVESGDLLGE